MLILFDIDGTLADISHRLHFVKHPPHVEGEWIDWTPDWDSFHDPEQVAKDLPIPEMVQIHNTLETANHEIHYVTGRPIELWDTTDSWLTANLIRSSPDLWMRPSGDHRPDYQIKEEILETIKTDYCMPDLAIDDRQQVVDMWRSHGIRTLQCAKGDF